ncbi:MAG: S8 family serine peptidase, partial [Candidatus Limnocylindria bacterium]
MTSGAHRRSSRPALVLLQILVFVTYVFGPTSTLAEEPIVEPTPTESTAPDVTPAPSAEPTAAPTQAPIDAPSATPEATPAPDPDPTVAPPAAPDPDPTPAAIPGTRPYIVTFSSGTTDARQLEILAAAGVTDETSIPQLSIRSVLLHDAGYADELTALRAYPEVVRVELDRTRAVEAAPSDTSFGDQWSLGQIGWNDLYGTVSIGGSSTVAILDTGVDASHPDLDGVVLPGASVLDGSNGLSDPNGHGTWMAGIVAAETDNGIGIAGTAYAGVSVLPVTVLGADGTGQDSDIIAGVVYAADAGADVILMSFSNPGYSAALQAAIDYAWDSGAVLVAATGNDGSGVATFPAGDRGVIGVASTDAADALAVGSNFGLAAFMAAPGESIVATSVGGGISTISGTSAAAASVAGAAALLSANEPFLSNGVIVHRLASTADPAGDPAQTGNGRLNLARA